MEYARLRKIALLAESELVAKLAKRYPLLIARVAEAVISEFLNANAIDLVYGQRSAKLGVGSLAINWRPSRTGRNPKSGEKVSVTEKSVPPVQSGGELRKRVNSNQRAREEAE